MKDITEILKSLRNVRLHAHEKSAMRSRLVQHIGSTAPVTPSNISWYSMLWSHQFKVAYASFFITLSVGSTVVFAAEQALPGDILYPVKTKVTERVERVFVASEPFEQAEFETKLVERRFEEAEKLDQKELLVKEDTKNKAREEIEKQAEKAEKALAKTRDLRQAQTKEPVESMMMQSFSAPVVDNESQSSKRGKSSDDSDRDDYDGEYDDEDDNRGSGKNDDDEDDSDLDKVFKKHKDIAKKLDIKKNNRSRDDK